MNQVQILRHFNTVFVSSNDRIEQKTNVTYLMVDGFKIGEGKGNNTQANALKLIGCEWG